MWSTKLPTTRFGGTAIANNVVFTGGLDGVVRGHDSNTGEQEFTLQASADLNARFSISGDFLLVPAGGPLIASEETAAPDLESAQELFAFLIGAGQVTPAT